MSAIKTRIMYVQRGWSPGRIGRVRLSKSGRTLFYGELVLESLGGSGYKANYFTREPFVKYWVSGPRKDGQDTLYPGVVEIDEDVRDEYWRDVRGEPSRISQASFRSLGAHATHSTR